MDIQRVLLSADFGPSKKVALDRIQQFCDGCLGVGCNPLCHLRKELREFDWEYLSVHNQSQRSYRSAQLNRLVQDVDYLWPIPDNYTELFTALRKNRRSETFGTCGMRFPSPNRVILAPVGPLGIFHLEMINSGAKMFYED